MNVEWIDKNIYIVLYLKGTCKKHLKIGRDGKII